MKYKILLAGIISITAQAQGAEILEITGSLNPVGSGARALGMGGAFIPVADDATAASWNPGGLIQLEKPEISIVGDWTHRTEDNSYADNSQNNHAGSIDATRLNYLSASYPFTALERNMIVSFNYQKLFEFGRNWNYNLHTQDEFSTVDNHHEYDQDGSIYAVGLAYAVQITPTFSLGATLNLWEDFLNKNNWQQRYHTQGSINYTGDYFVHSVDQYDEYNFSGHNFNLGLLWQMTPKLTLGAVLKTPFDADVTHIRTENASTNVDGPSTTQTNGTLKMPLAYGLGIAYRHSDRLTLAIDLYRTEWSHFAWVGADDLEYSPLSGKPFFEVGKIKDILWVRAGGEYLFMLDELIIPLRAGIFYDPAPAENDQDEFYGFSLGSGVAWNDIVFDVAYQYRIGRNVGKAILPQQTGFSQDVTEQRIYASLIVHF